MAKSKKIILINHYASIPRWPGPTRNFDFAATLVQLGWGVNLFSCKFNHYLRRYLPNPPASERGVKLKWVWSTPYRGNSLARELNILVFSKISFLRGLFTSASIVVAVSPPLESAFSAWLLARVKRVPFVMDVEDLWPDSIIVMGFKNKLVIKWLRFLESFLYRNSDHILVVALEMKEYLMKCGVPETKINFVPLGANLPEGQAPRQEVLAEYGWAEDQIIAVYVGAHGPANALETLIKAAQILPASSQVKLVLFGDGSDRPRLQELLAEFNLNNITLENPIAPEKVPDILQAADIGIASLKDTATFKTVRPNKLYEYMAAGLPIVCCIGGEAGRLVDETGSGLNVKPEDYQDLAAALQRLAVDPEERKKLSHNGRDYALKSGDRNKLAAQMGDILKKVIDG